MDRSQSRSRRRPRHPSPYLSPSSTLSSSSSRSSSRSHSPRRRARLAPSRRRALDSGLLKDSAGFLLGIAVAVVTAHRFWAKGALHDAKNGDGEARPGHQSRHRSHDAGGADDKVCDDCRSRGHESRLLPRPRRHHVGRSRRQPAPVLPLQLPLSLSARARARAPQCQRREAEARRRGQARAAVAPSGATPAQEPGARVRRREVLSARRHEGLSRLGRLFRRQEAGGEGLADITAAKRTVVMIMMTLALPELEASGAAAPDSLY